MLTTGSKYENSKETDANLNRSKRESYITGDVTSHVRVKVEALVIIVIEPYYQFLNNFTLVLLYKKV